MPEGKDLTPQERFEEKIYSRLREDVAELLPDDVLAEMTKRALEKMFFEPKRINEGSASYPRWTDRPSWFEARVERLMRERLAQQVDVWMRANRERLAGEFAKAMTAVMPALVGRAIFAPIDTAVANSQENVQRWTVEYLRRAFEDQPLQFPEAR